MDNFTAIRNGLLDHALAGKLSPFDFGLYVFLIMRADYATGIYRGCALTIAWQFGDPSQKEHIQKSLRRLRDKKYLNYRNGDGRRGAYSILINKFLVTVGELSGTRLNAWKHNGLATPEYESENCNGTVVAQSRNSGGTVVAPNKDLKTENVKDVKDKPPLKNGVHPTLQDVILYCKERGNIVNPQLWMDHYQSNGWKVGPNPMRDWKAAVRTWETNQLRGKPNASRAQQNQDTTVQAVRDAIAAVRKADDGMVH